MSTMCFNLHLLIFSFLTLIISTYQNNAKPILNAFVPEHSQKQGSQFTLTCSVVYGDSPIDFRWTKDNQLIDNNSNGSQITSIGLVSILVIANISPTHSGNYSCFASNEHGFDSRNTRLNVQGVATIIYCHCIIFFQLYLTVQIVLFLQYRQVGSRNQRM